MGVGKKEGCTHTSTVGPRATGDQMSFTPNV
jgi:hypothetical protein